MKYRPCAWSTRTACSKLTIERSVCIKLAHLGALIKQLNFDKLSWWPNTATPSYGRLNKRGPQEYHNQSTHTCVWFLLSKYNRVTYYCTH